MFTDSSMGRYLPQSYISKAGTAWVGEVFNCFWWSAECQESWSQLGKKNTFSPPWPPLVTSWRRFRWGHHVYLGELMIIDVESTRWYHQIEAFSLGLQSHSGDFGTIMFSKVLIPSYPVLLFGGGHKLVGGLEHEFYFFHILGISSSQLTNSYFFRGLSIPPTSQYFKSLQLSQIL